MKFGAASYSGLERFTRTYDCGLVFTGRFSRLHKQYPGHIFGPFGAAMTTTSDSLQAVEPEKRGLKWPVSGLKNGSDGATDGSMTDRLAQTGQLKRRSNGRERMVRTTLGVHGERILYERSLCLLHRGVWRTGAVVRGR